MNDVSSHSAAPIIVPPRATAATSEPAETAPTQYDRHLHHIAEHGRMAWQGTSGYTRRALAEAATGRWNQVVGDGLRAHNDERRATEVKSLSTRSAVCWIWNARTTSASPDCG